MYETCMAAVPLFFLSVGALSFTIWSSRSAFKSLTFMKSRSLDFLGRCPSPYRWPGFKPPHVGCALRHYDQCKQENHPHQLAADGCLCPRQNELDQLLDRSNTGSEMWADSTYSAETEAA